jgi:hypothetical protein
MVPIIFLIEAVTIMAANVWSYPSWGMLTESSLT